ncbi:MAG: DUF1579 domain-containing protein [Phycisphaerae bacterium]
MKTRVLLGAAVFVAATAVIAAQVASQDKDKTGQPGEEMMQAWMKYAGPGKFHAHLQPLVGRWTQEVKMWMAPDAPPQIETGTSEYKWILGGRFLLQTVKGDSTEQGPAFEGLGIIGYDNFKKKYTSMWADTMTTAIMTALGTCDDSGKVFTFIGRHDDVFSGKPDQTVKTITRIINNDSHVDEMYMTGPDGKEFKTLEVTYTRK